MRNNVSPLPPSEIKVMGNLCMLNGQPAIFLCPHQLPGGELRVLLWVD